MGEENELSIENILTGDEADAIFSMNDDTDVSMGNIDPDKLFGGASDDDSEEKDKKDKDKKTTDVDPTKLFAKGDEGDQESVGSGNDNMEDTQVSGQGTSPKFYSSIAKALVDEGIFQDFNVSDDEIKNIKDAEDFVNLAKKWSESIRAEDDKRVLQALNAEMEPTLVRQYEQTIRTLDSISEENLKGESEQDEDLRKRIIYQDYINRKFSPERAKKAMERSFAAGTDIEDALESFASVKEHFTSAYQEEIRQAQEEKNEQINRIKKEVEQFKKDLLDSAEPLKGLKLEKNIRMKAYDAATKIVGKDEDGTPITAIQKAEMNDPVQFRKALAVLYTLTDGFQNIGALIKKEAKKETRKGMLELEHSLLNNTSRSLEGTLQFAGGDFDEDVMKDGLLLGE